jgi:hypothetical protein
MFEFLGLGKNKTAKATSDSGPSTLPPTMQLGPTRIEMVRLTLHGVLKLYGIPATWIAGEVIPIHIPGQGEALLLQLDIRHWHDALILHAKALEQALLDGLRGFDPYADETRYLFTWKFSPQSGCPYVHLPQPVFWQTSDRFLMAPVPPPDLVAAPAAHHVADVPPVLPTAIAASSTANVAPPPIAIQEEEDDDEDDGFPRTHIRDDS